MKLKGLHLYWGDFCIIALIVALAIAIFIWMLPTSAAETTVEIYLQGDLLYSIPLEEGIYDTLSIDSVVHNTIELNGTEVRVIEADCYDSVCLNTGVISQVGEIIVCMPNQLLIKIVGDSSTLTLDGVVG